MFLIQAKKRRFLRNGMAPQGPNGKLRNELPRWVPLRLRPATAPNKRRNNSFRCDWGSFRNLKSQCRLQIGFEAEKARNGLQKRKLIGGTG